MKDLSILPECYVDTNLIETLLNGTEVNHQKGCGTVAKKMIENFSDAFALGIIDKDKKDIDYLKEFVELHQTEHLILHKHKNKDHYIIQIVPVMERFILHCMNSVQLELSDYGIPDEFDKFKKQSKSINSKDDPTFKRLFKKLVKESEPSMILLKSWVNYLKDNKYAVSADQLKAFDQG